MKKIIRVVRVLEYEGEEQRVLNTLSKSAVDGERDFGGFTIKETVRTTPFIIEQEQCSPTS